MATGEDAPELALLAKTIARAEAVAGDRAASRAALPAALRVAVALILSGLGLLLPWSRHDDVLRDAFWHSAPLAVLTLLTVVAGCALLTVYVAAPSASLVSACRAVTGLGGAVSMMAGLAVLSGIKGPEHQWWGLALFEPAMLAAILLTAALPDTELVHVSLLGTDPVPSLDAAAERVRTALSATRPRVELPLGLLGGGALVLAAAGVTASWQQLTGRVVTVVAGHSVVWRGPDLVSTLPVRWGLAAGLAAVLVTAAVPPLRRLLPLMLLAAGVVVAGLSVASTSGVAVRGTKASIGVGPGAWIVLAGGVVAALCGAGLLVAAGRRRPRPAAGRRRPRPAVAAVAVAVAVLALAAGPGHLPRADAEPAGLGTRVLPGVDTDSDEQLGGSADRSVFSTYEIGTGEQDELPVVATSLDGRPGTWFVRPESGDPDEDVYLIDEIVHGRALPVTEVSGARDLRLLGVTGRRAIVFWHESSQTAVVSSVDLSADSAHLFSSTESSSDEYTTTLLTTADFRPEGPGHVEADDLYLDLLADGSAAVTVHKSGSRDTSYLVDAGTVRGSAPWRLTRQLPAGSVESFHAPGGTTYDVAAGTINRLTADGRTQPVLGQVSDRRCTLSRDPLSSSLDDYAVYDSSPAVDRAGNMWLALSRDVEPRLPDLYVLTADGVLRRLPATWHGAGKVQVAADGSLFVTFASKWHGGATYRLADPVAAARVAAPLPPVPSGCVSDNRATVTTAGRTATRVGTLPPQQADPFSENVLAVLDANGTSLSAVQTSDSGDTYSGTTTLRRTGPRRSPTAVYSARNVWITDVVPDGRGGAWWLQLDPPNQNDDGNGEGQGPGSIGHVDAAGRALIVAARVVPADPDPRADVELAADPADNSLWWTPSEHGPWHRTTTDGPTTPLRYRGGIPTLGGGAGYYTASEGVYPITAGGSGPAVLGSRHGRALRLPSALAAHAVPADYSPLGTVAVTSTGALLLYQGDYLARFGPGGRVSLLSGPHEGLPQENDVMLTTVVGNRLVITTYAGAIYTVDVS